MEVLEQAGHSYTKAYILYTKTIEVKHLECAESRYLLLVWQFPFFYS